MTTDTPRVDLDAICQRADKLAALADREKTGFKGQAYVTAVALAANLSAADVPDLLAEVDRLRAELEKTRAVAQTYRNAMVSQHEWAGHLINDDCEPCRQAADNADGDMACSRYQAWQREYEAAMGTHLPLPAVPDTTPTPAGRVESRNGRPVTDVHLPA